MLKNHTFSSLRSKVAFALAVIGVNSEALLAVTGGDSFKFVLYSTNGVRGWASFGVTAWASFIFTW